MKTLSAYGVNTDGVLVYTGLPTASNDITHDDYLGKGKEGKRKGKYEYEVYGWRYVKKPLLLEKVEFVHGHPESNRTSGLYLLINNTYRFFE